MCIPHCPKLAQKHAGSPGELGLMARGYRDGRAGLDPSDTAPQYESSWLVGSDDRDFLLKQGRTP